MKLSIILILILMSIVTICDAQAQEITTDQEIANIKLNLGKYAKQQTRGIVFQVTGSIVSLIGATLVLPQSKTAGRVITGIGVAMSIGGWFTYHGAGKYLRRIELGIVGNSASLGVTF